MNGRIDMTNRIVWQACERFRGVIDPGRYNNHLLAMLFLKYASDSHESQSNAGRRFVVPDNSRFGYLLEHCDDKDIDLLTDRAFDSLVSANPDRLGGEEGVGLFDGIRFCNPLLGSAGERTARLRRLLSDLSDERLRFGVAEAGSVCSSLIERFACDAGKKPEEGSDTESTKTRNNKTDVSDKTKKSDDEEEEEGMFDETVDTARNDAEPAAAEAISTTV